MQKIARPLEASLILYFVKIIYLCPDKEWRSTRHGADGSKGPAGDKTAPDIQTISSQAFRDELLKYRVESLIGLQSGFTMLISLAPKTRPGISDVIPDRPTEREAR